MELLGALERWDLQVHWISNFKRQFPSSFVHIALLSAMGHFQVLPDLSHILLSLLDQIWTKENPLANLGPHQRCHALPSIERLKGWHLKTCLIAVIVQELSIRQSSFPKPIYNKSGQKPSRDPPESGSPSQFDHQYEDSKPNCTQGWCPIALFRLCQNLDINS